MSGWIGGFIEISLVANPWLGNFFLISLFEKSFFIFPFLSGAGF